MVSERLLASVGPFYHVTSANNWQAIGTEGLRTDRCNKADAKLPGVVGPYVCLTIRGQESRYLHALREKFEGEETVTIEIATDAVVHLRVDLDRTTSELLHYERVLGTSDEPTLVKAGLPLICYDDIPVTAMKTVERHPPR